MSEGFAASIRPLTFLFVRTFVNGVRRAISSPKRLLGILFFLGYYWFLIARPFQRSGDLSRSHFAGRKLPVPALLPGAVEAIVFAAFSAISLLLLLGLLAPRGNFKGADVDVLFPTPISPRAVLLFRFLREYLVTLILPVFILAISGLPTIGALSGLGGWSPGGGNVQGRALGVWIGAAITWTALAFAVSMVAGRMDEGGERRARRIRWAIFALVSLPPLIFSVMFRSDPTAAGAIAAAQSPLLRIPLFLASASSAIVFGGTGAVVGAAILALVTAASILVAIREAEWMYDAAASRGGDDRSTLRELTAKQDVVGIRVHQARKGKIRRGKLSARAALIEVRGGAAILWREVVTALRLNFALGATLGLLVFGYPIFLFFLPAPRRDASMVGYAFLAVEAFMIATVGMGLAQTGFIEVLRKVDTTKPLPFGPSQVVRWEVLAKSLPSAAGILIVSLVAAAISPGRWPFALSLSLAGPALVVALTSVQFVLAVLFPDFEDPTQRGFRAMMGLIAMAGTLAPIAVPFVGAAALRVSPLAAVPVAIALALAISAGALAWAGSLYADFNPSE